MKTLKKIVALFLAIVAFSACVSALSEAEIREVDGDVVSVRLVNGYIEVTVSADDGNLYAYYDDGTVYFGRVHLLIFGEDEVIDVISYTALSMPF